MTRRARLSPSQRVQILLEEYRALYRLAEMRMVSLDRRVPLAGTAVTAFLGGTTLLPPASQLAVLVLIPLSLVWLARTTVNHARSFEDAIRRIEQIERRVNRIAGSELLGFQSTHPSRGRAVGGRTGEETVRAVVMLAAAVLGGCLTVAIEGRVPFASTYAVYVAVIAVCLMHLIVIRRRYRYRESD